MISSMPEFIRGNQRSYLRIVCDREELEKDYEYHMYIRNDIKLLLRGNFRNMEGEEYLYFDISARQSLDVLLQVRKLDREMTRRLFTDILRLCDEADKYLLNLQKVSFRSRHIMYSQEQKDFRFLYNFSGQGEQWQQDLVQFSEMLVERLDYADDKLMEVIYRFYEMVADSQEAINLRGLAGMVLSAVSASRQEGAGSPAGLEDYLPDQEYQSGEAGEKECRFLDKETWNPDGMSDLSTARPQPASTPAAPKREKKKRGKREREDTKQEDASASTVRVKYKKGMLVEMLLFLGADAVSVFLIEPGNVSVIILQATAALICLIMIGRQLWFWKKKTGEKSVQELEQQEEAAADELREEFQNLMRTGDQLLEGTQIITMEEVFPKLYSVYGREPEFIEIVGHQLIGSQDDLVQVCLRYSGVSRIHASLRRDPQGNSVLEDLNSTNGTWVNDSRLAPRVPYTLKRGDKVSFAGCEYIFR